MAISGSVKLQGTITGTLYGDIDVGGTLGLTHNAGTNERGVGYAIALELASGANTITVPTGATGVLIVFDPTSTQAKTLKGVGGDTGFTVTKTGFLFIGFDAAAPPASFVINSAAADTGKTTKVLFV